MKEIYLVYYKNNDVTVYGTSESADEAESLRKQAIKSEIKEYEAYIGSIPLRDVKLIMSWVNIKKIKLGEKLNLQL